MGGEGGDPAEGVDRLHLEVLSDGVDVALVISSKARRDSRTLRVEKVSLAQVLWMDRGRFSPGQSTRIWPR